MRTPIYLYKPMFDVADAERASALAPVERQLLAAMVLSGAEMEPKPMSVIAEQAGLGTLSAAQHVRTLLDAGLIRRITVRARRFHWQLTEIGAMTGLAALPRRRGRLHPRALGLSDSGWIGVVTPAGRTFQARLVDPADRGRLTPPKRRRATAADRRAARKQRVAKALLKRVVAAVAEAAAIDELAEILEQMAADGEIERVGVNTYRAHPAASMRSRERTDATETLRGGRVSDTQLQIMRAVDAASRPFGWASSRDVAEALNCTPAALLSHFDTLRFFELLETWKPNTAQTVSLHRLTDLGHAELRRAHVGAAPVSSA